MIEVRDLRNGDWYWIHKAILQKHAKYLGVYGLAVYNALAFFAGSDGKAFPSLSTIEKMLGISRPTILEAIRKLEKRKIIKVKRGGGRKKVNQFYLLRIKVNDIKETVNLVKKNGKPDLPEQELLTRITNNNKEKENLIKEKESRGLESCREVLEKLGLKKRVSKADPVRAYFPTVGFSPTG